MKKIFFIAFAIVLIGCKKEIKADYAIITGKILNKQAGDVSINSEDGTFKEIISVKEDGTFVDTLSTDISTYVLYDGFNPIFINVESGYNLNITYDVKAFDNSITISGVGSEINNYLIEKRKAEKEFSKNIRAIFALNESEYKASIQDYKVTQEKLLNNSKSLPSDFMAKEKKNIHFGYLSKLNSFERSHIYVTNNKDFKVSDDFLKAINSLDVTNVEDFKFSNDYKVLVTDYYGKKASELVNYDGSPFDMAFLETVSNVKDETIKNTLLFEFANSNMSYAKDVNAFYNSFLESSTNEKNNAFILEKYNKLTGLNKGKPSPKFVGFENYAGGKTSLDDLKGKYVYIDIWATWCRPCLNEIPALKTVEKQFHGKNIEFVSISVDKASDHEKWKNMVKTKELGGIQLFANEGSSFIKDYQVEGIPRFILIDTEGHIVDSNAPRPTDRNLVNVLNALSI